MLVEIDENSVRLEVILPGECFLYRDAVNMKAVSWGDLRSDCKITEREEVVIDMQTGQLARMPGSSYVTPLSVKLVSASKE